MSQDTTTTTYQSDGSDGYTPGTWGYTISGEYGDGTPWSMCDGGYADREQARAAARDRAPALGEVLT